MAVVHTQILPNATLDTTKNPPVLTGDLTIVVDAAFELPLEGVQEFVGRAPGLAADIAERYAHRAAIQAVQETVDATVAKAQPWSLLADPPTPPA